MPSADAGNLSFVRTIVLNRLVKITPNITIFLVLFFFGEQSALPVSAHNIQSCEFSTFFNGRMT